MFNNGVDLQLRIMEILGDITAASRLENLRCSFATDGREMYMRFNSKGDLVRSCTRSHVTVQG